MFACLYAPNLSPAASVDLFELAGRFSPGVEVSAPGALVFSITGLKKLIGNAHQIAAEIARRGAEMGIQANLAIASNPDTALLSAQNLAGVTVIPLGQEAVRLSTIPIANLLSIFKFETPEVLETLHRWGIHTCEDLAGLPETGVAERLGARGIFLRNLARGATNRPLKISPPPASYQERMETEYPVALLEPLLFLLARVLTNLCQRLRAQSLSTNKLNAQLELENKSTHSLVIQLPVPMNDAKPLLKLLQLELEAHPPESAVIAFMLTVEPVEPRSLQTGLFLPLTPQPEKLCVTLARIAGMVGEENVGSPELLNTHRPDAFCMRNFPGIASGESAPNNNIAFVRLAIRIFRPPLRAQVRLVSQKPNVVIAPGVQGTVLTSAGPWRTSGEWWANTAWARDEWDIALNDGALYRIYCEDPSRNWYVHGIYD